MAKIALVRPELYNPGGVPLQRSGAPPIRRCLSLLFVKEFETDGLHNRAGMAVSAGYF